MLVHAVVFDMTGNGFFFRPSEEVDVQQQFGGKLVFIADKYTAYVV